MNNHIEVVRTLISKGANVEAFDFVRSAVLIFPSFLVMWLVYWQ
jgi:hypothetical protein